MNYHPGSEGISATAPAAPAPRLMDEVRRRLRLKHYSLRTEKVYVAWIRRFILFHGKRHPRSMGAAEVERFYNSRRRHSTIGYVSPLQFEQQMQLA